MKDMAAIRTDTPCENAYLNHTAASVPPLPVAEAVARYFTEIMVHGSKWSKNSERHRAALRRTRADIGLLINAPSGASEIALTQSGSEGIATIARGIHWQQGDEIILSRAEMVANISPWVSMANRHRLKISFADIEQPGVISVDSIHSLITPRTRLISVTHAPNMLGTVQPLAEIGELARANGTMFMVDASATAGVVPIDVQQFGCDFLAASGRKYLRGPAGTGFLYVRSERIPEIEPLVIGWMTAAWDSVTGELKPHPTIDRFSGGEPAFPAWIGLGRAVEYVEEVGGVSRIWDRVKTLGQYTIDALSQVKGVRVLGASGDRRNGAINFLPGDRDPKFVAEYLQARGVICEAGSGFCVPPLQLYGVDTAVRFAVHYWNTEQDIDYAVGLLPKVIG